MKSISFTVDEMNLNGTIFHPPQLKPLNPAVLFVHGWGSQEIGYFSRAEAISELGAICMTFNMRGHGSSDGKRETFSRAEHLKDVEAAYDYLVAQPNVDTQKIAVIGASYGGYLSAVLSGRRNIKWLILRAPALYKDDNFTAPTASLMNQDTYSYRQQKLQPEGNMALTALTKYTGKVLVVESEFDTVVPHQTVENYKVALTNDTNSTSTVLPGADHGLSTQTFRQAYIQLLTETFKNWFRE